MATGTVKWFSGEEGFGFITPSYRGADLIVYSGAIKGEGYKSLKEGQPVKFNAVKGQDGMHALDVEPADSVLR